jgi:hypothetical protein
VFSVAFCGIVTSSVTFNSSSMTLSGTQIDKLCQSLLISIFPSNRPSEAATPTWERSQPLFLHPLISAFGPSGEGNSGQCSTENVLLKTET